MNDPFLSDGEIMKILGAKKEYLPWVNRTIS